MWPLLRALKKPAEGGGDPHILDMAPTYQTAVKRLREAADCPRMLVTGEFRIFPDSPALYSDTTGGGRSRGGRNRGERARLDMERIRKAAEGDEKVLLTSVLELSLHCV